MDQGLGQGHGNGPVARYRVEHISRGRATVVDYPGWPPTHHTALVPYAVRLQQAGVLNGELVAVDAASGRILARRTLETPVRPPRWKPTRQPHGRPVRYGGPAGRFNA